MVLDRSFSSVGAEGSGTRRTFEEDFVEDVATAAGVGEERVQVEDVSEGSVVVEVSIAAGGDDEVSVQDAVDALQEQLSDASSALRTGTVTGDIDVDQGIASSFTSLPSAALRDDPNGILLQETSELQLKQGLVARVKVFSAKELAEGGAAVEGESGEEKQFLYVRLEGEEEAGSGYWMAVGFNGDGEVMVGADVVLGEFGGDGVSAKDITAKAVSGVQDDDTATALLQLAELREDVDGKQVLEYTRSVSANGFVELEEGQTYALVWARGDSATLTGAHSSSNRGTAQVDPYSGQVSTPSPAPALRLAHGVLMFLAWGILSPFALFCARCCRHQTSWFDYHWKTQVATLLLASIALILIVVATPSHLATTHSVIGLCTLLLAYLQPLNACIRPHAPPQGKPTPCLRTLWEFVHKGAGATTQLLAFAAIPLGLLAIGAPIPLLGAAAAILAIWILTFLASFCWTPRKREKDRRGKHRNITAHSHNTDIA